MHEFEGYSTKDTQTQETNQQGIEHPERELFLWALLLNRKNLALMFWRLGSDHIGGALTASMLSQSLSEVAEQDEELDLAEQLRNDSA